MNHRRFLVLLFGVVLLQSVTIQAEQQDTPPKDNAPKFELLDGDRVVFLGNTLIEREQKYGYWETMLTARYPNRNIIFRNLGWDGDTVWADSRGLFDKPAKGYQRMLEHVGKIKPTVIFLGYGNNEAFAGKKGLPAFIKQYNKLIDDLKKVSAKNVRFVILSPIRHENLGPPLPDSKEINLKTDIYTKELSKLAQKRKMLFIDLFSTVVSAERADPELFFWPRNKGLTSDFSAVTGYRPSPQPHLKPHIISHLRPSGYRRSGDAIYSQLALRSNMKLELNADGTVKEAKGMKVENVMATKKGLSFSVTNERLFIGNEWLQQLSKSHIAVKGLPRGKYKLKVDGKTAGAPRVSFSNSDENIGSTLSLVLGIHKYSSKVWGKGITFTQGPDYGQLEELRHVIKEKNLLYFYSWRPQNVTYLFLFRKHEQGQNAKEIEELRKLVAEKEKEIARLKKPVTHTYELIRVKDTKKQ